MFAISAQNYLAEYHPVESMMGADALDGDIDVADLEDGSFGWMEFNGERLRRGVTQIGGTYYISAVPESDMVASRNLTVGVILPIFFSVP